MEATKRTLTKVKHVDVNATIFSILVVHRTISALRLRLCWYVERIDGMKFVLLSFRRSDYK